MGDLAADLGHRRGQLLGGGGDRADAGRGLLGGGSRRGRARSEVPLTLAVISPATRCMSAVALRDRADHALDVGLEAVGHLALQRLLLEFGLLLGGLLRLAQRAGLDHVAAEHVDRHRHGAEFVLALAAGDRHIGVAARQAVHHRGDRGQRPRQAAAEQERQQHGAGQDRDGAEHQIALRTRRRRLVFGGVLDDFEHRDRLAGIVLDLPEIERGGMAVERGVAVQRCAIEHALQLVLGGDHGVAEGRGQLLEGLAVEPMHGEVDAEALLGAVDEFLAEGDADIGDWRCSCRRA